MRQDLNKRERYEWCNTWWEDANNAEGPRVLLVGDSITVGYRPFVNELLKNEALADMYASSRGLDDPSYAKELKYMLSEYPYRVIHLNNGLHGMHLSEGEYREGFIATVQLISEIQPEAVIVLVTSTPVTKDGIPEEISDAVNSVVIARNASLRKIAQKYALPINDLYSLMLGKSGLCISDGYHYNTDGQKLQAETVVSAVKNAIKG
jgi:lysophospholipase L1-like esterase